LSEEQEQHFNILFLGGGSGGYVGAIRAAQLGMNVAVVERDKLGGTCLHRGCIPSKAYLEAAQVYTEVQEAAGFGITVGGEIGYDFGRIQTYREQVVNDNWKGVQFLMKKNKITVIEGDGTITAPGAVTVRSHDDTQQRLTADNLVIGTGTRPRTLGIEVDGRRVFTSDNVWSAEGIPGSVIVLGGGYIGCEFASFYRAFGVDVTIVEMLPGLIPMMDQDLGRELQRAFNKRGIKILTSSRADPESVRSTEDHVELTVDTGDGKQTLQADYLLLAAAREGVTDGLGLEGIGVEMERGLIKIGEGQRTNVSNVYAVGDIAGGLGLAHKAYAEGILASETIAGQNQLKTIDMNRVPQPIFCFPQVASVGMTEQQALDSGAELAIGKFPYSANAKARILNDTTGFVKLIADKRSGDVLGVHMIGPGVTEMISESALAKFLESTPWEMAYNIHPHPTLSEAIGEAAHAAEGAAIHI
jgi:dihydrolipoamide dehydrogenase